MLVALISALASAVGLIVDKISLSRNRISLNTYIPVVFIFLFLFTAVFVPFRGYVNWDVVMLPNMLFLLFLMVIIAVAWNVLFYQSIQRESVHEHELISMTGPVVTILLAALFFPEEFNLKIFIIALIASLALVFARAEKKHFTFDKTSYNLILAVVLMSVESIIVRELLYQYSPETLYAVRTFFMAAFFTAYYRPKFKQISTKHWLLMAASGAVGALLMITRFYAFESLGIIHTTIIAVLAPIIVFLASWEILHERIRARVIIASMVILVCVVLATLALPK